MLTLEKIANQIRPVQRFVGIWPAEEAIDQFQQALRIRPQFAEAREGLRQTLVPAGKKRGRE